MTIAETLIVSVLTGVFSAMLTTVLNNKNKVTNADFKKAQEIVSTIMDNHKKDVNPHVDCPVHTVQLSNIQRVVNRIDSRIYRLLGGVGTEDDE